MDEEFANLEKLYPLEQIILDESILVLLKFNHPSAVNLYVFKISKKIKSN